ncbi:carbonic anhydrase [Vibrio sp. S9_S30]|uniref:carbonic anhydrase n=1 Tax=Vibrio sp. S9_S30 TaxID=2720226 RepID=UPI00167FF044|nr:carbonic anhydrase family protein [Vibrio sp. S9_S30]MBD1557486.1 carbonic anhydrase [Vibrio sp. S9_S30]
MENVKLKLLVGLLVSSFAFPSVAIDWSYKGEHGVDEWAKLFTMCGEGKNQSPVNISDALKAKKQPITLTYHGSATEVVNNGHAIQVNVSGHNTLTLEGGEYELKQFHFHTPSENTILGRQFPLEVHFVHENTKGQLAVVGIMYELESKPNQSLKALLSDTLESKERKPLETGFDLAQLLPDEQDYYRFNGSLTTPPCSEGVRWVLMKEPLGVSKEQIETFAQSTGMNARPIQAINGRIVVK